MACILYYVYIFFGQKDLYLLWQFVCLDIVVCDFVKDLFVSPVIKRSYIFLCQKNVLF